MEKKLSTYQALRRHNAMMGPRPDNDPSLPMKLPRKVKKIMKKKILSIVDPAWRMKEVRVRGINRRTGRITSYMLIQ